jgi:molecular chaperone HtpG
MADPTLSSYAESRAQAATKYEGFGVSLSEIKRTTTELLSQIGRHGFFAEYSKHDISHIDEVIRLAEWLVDDDSKKVMTDADWFLITLSIYFHDMGMLVTRDEYATREQSGFSDFCKDVLFTGPRSDDYQAKIDELPPEDRDIFLYQEFVRFNHAKRVRQWIEGDLGPELGVASAAAGEVQRILANLDPTLRRDLALIAESHHLDDLDDLSKYKLVQPYGATDPETANIQYCAIILRAADLLHMRRDRTPSVLFRIINPTDPISQREWAKQNAVRRVMPRPGVNEEGVPDDKAPKDTIEIHATFKEENGFFGLTSFLSYAAKELRKCHDWAETARKTKGSKYSFVWKRIAEDQIETQGFLKKTYSFDLDQHKILDLLIGHTLYNDTGVVLRELAQNGIDAIRLQETEDRKKGVVSEGALQVIWESGPRVLTITDNGTGMTQDIIENHLLKVGSSRYQDQKFKESHPSFSAISRFGIGVLSTFMVSDEVEITTCSLGEDQARKISLRSVHGRYLVRLLDKNRDQEAIALAPHGTKVRLKIRSTAKLGDVLSIMRRWVVIPRCNVTVSVDGGELTAVGFKSAAAAIEAYMADVGLSTVGDPPQYKVITRRSEGIEFAYAARWSAYYKDWSIAGLRNRTTANPVPCTCVEGIAVVFATPAMNTPSLIAIANATGSGAPKTNVARSTLEATPERNNLYSALYGLYVEHVKDEIDRLTKAENYSLTWAANNAITLVPFGLNSGIDNDAVLPSELRNSLKSLPIYIVEKLGKRINISFNELTKEDLFWTVDCQLVRSAEQLVREVKSNSNVADLVKALGDPAQALPDGTILYNLDVSAALRDSVELEFEPCEICASEGLRRADIKWTRRTSDRWIRAQSLFNRVIDNQRAMVESRITAYLEQKFRHSDGRRGSNLNFDPRQVWLAYPAVDFRGIEGYSGITSQYRTFLRGDIPIAAFLREIASHAEDQAAISRLQIFSWVFLAASEAATEQAFAFASTQLRNISGDLGEEYTKGRENFLDALRSGPLPVFNTSVWSNRHFGLG